MSTMNIFFLARIDLHNSPQRIAQLALSCFLFKDNYLFKGCCSVLGGGKQVTDYNIQHLVVLWNMNSLV